LPSEKIFYLKKYEKITSWHGYCNSIEQEVLTMRIIDHPILSFDNREMVTFTLNGQKIEGVAGEPIAAALHAAGVKVLHHSHKNHRPRGLFCAIGNCSSCLMTVDKIPNVRVCVEPLRAGVVVETQEGKGKII